MENMATESSMTQASLSDSLARKILLRALAHLAEGHLTIVDGNQTSEFGNVNSNVHATMQVKHANFYRQVVFGGSIGAGEAYIQGHWSSQDLTKVVQIFAKNLALLDNIERYFSWLSNSVNRIKHVFNRNSEQGSKRNILAHYDLGNDMYKQFLDPEMMYSSALYPNDDSNLNEAQLHKLQTICERLDLSPGQTLLEVGTGWGALAIYAAKHYGVNVTTTTISDAQYEFAVERVKQLGLEDKITLLKQDYRLLTGEYDRIVSIEMIEAVGHEYLGGFFEKLQHLLKSEGRMLIQAITIADQRYDSYRKSVDFIQRYIFPGGCLPSVSEMTRHIAKKTDMVTWSIDDMGRDYARTLKHWHENFDAAYDKIKALNYGDDFIRMWKFYLSYCEGGFLERTTSTVHLVAVRPLYRP
ncbi:SAM-dependent methyltransferase [Shewanella psychromarinicola]|uniref:Class I SAM-dependent methyltransferase n=1 Tax=Shewanella psychromarinicola TaxID=2487742 RepID=A0A3N4E7V3_9GAMM|nr:cyclopropane-fatty-acyl-phospholipid synthase family protein [Shewanella psychromarinicola]AZG35172.1 class I SAM-dependent methyltransferase [Shewanella psychromarinicola]MCL1083387.1 cyclopropane-fatty-acyl-phospholipid synthase family protein [Shewanella psychromarinicola]RPA33026.1 class I SAM-dependent methyltransferase [Shewanella psychromarinicola]